MRLRLIAVLVLAACCAAACGGSASPGRARHSAARSGPATPAPAPPRPTAPPPAARRAAVVRARLAQISLPDGARVTVAVFRGPAYYVLHAGSVDPGSAALSVVHAGPSIGATERPRVVAAFNGGFLLSAGAGGYEQEGHVISPLRPGLASLVISRSGHARIAVWRRGAIRPAAVFSVRQNLGPLVRRGRPSPAIADWQAWGATLSGGESVARSALGENRAGQLIYAGSMSASPADLATALIRAGARIAMELDINPEWVQLDISRHPGWRLRAAIPGQVRPAGQYLSGWTRDFVAVTAPRRGRA